MESLASLYKNHIATLQERTRDALARFKLDALLIHSGELFNVFLDDHPYPFKVNPQFAGAFCYLSVGRAFLRDRAASHPRRG
jgi:hypothetical protein